MCGSLPTVIHQHEKMKVRVKLNDWWVVCALSVLGNCVTQIPPLPIPPYPFPHLSLSSSLSSVIESQFYEAGLFSSASQFYVFVLRVCSTGIMKWCRFPPGILLAISTPHCGKTKPYIGPHLDWIYSDEDWRMTESAALSLCTILVQISLAM